MEPNTDKRFDPLLAAQLLLEIAEEQAVEPILKKIVEQAVERTESVFSQVWLVEKRELPQPGRDSAPGIALFLGQSRAHWFLLSFWANRGVCHPPPRAL